MSRTALPFFASGTVIKGFGRGSKELGIPTANFPQEVVNGLPKELNTGVYYGWASIDNGPVYKMVMSVGWNPYFKNIHKSMETHIMHKFDNDFYGSNLKVCMTYYSRPEMDFKSLDELITTIKNDIDSADVKLEEEEQAKYKSHSFFTNNSISSNGSVNNS